MKKVVLTVVVIFIIVFAIVLGIIWGTTANSQYQEELLAEQQQLWGEINDNALPASWFQEDGFDNVSDWWTEIYNLKNENANLVSEAMLALGNHLNEEQISRLTEIESAIRDSHSINEINQLLEEATGIIADAESDRDYAEALKAQSVTNESPGATSTVSYKGGSYSSGDASNFKSQGVVYMDGVRYTWYSQRVLPGGGLNIPGRHVDNGFVKDGDGNIVVASDFDARGSIVNTPYGQGKVYDSGAGANTRDLYTDY